MKEHFQIEVAGLRDRFTALGRTVIDNVRMASEALRTADIQMAKAVLHAENHVDYEEVRIEEECLKVIALHQPVADDLRLLVGMIHINHELERISDLAAALAKRVKRVSPEVARAYAEELNEIGILAGAMAEDALRAFLDRDVEAAKRVWRGDDEVDDACDRLADQVRTDILAQTGDDPARFELLPAIADFERMADHAANIGKAVLYQILGHIVRHRGREFRPRTPGQKLRVLFVCVHNSARSRMAAGWLNHLHGDRFEAESAGITPGDINPLAIQVMREEGIDIPDSAPRDVVTATQSGAKFDYVITVCDAASAERCPPVLGIAQQIQWEFEDPSSFSGTDPEKLRRTRMVRDAIRDRIEEWTRVSAP
jgi:phosphate transport system regulatory protein PhoU